MADRSVEEQGRRAYQFGCSITENPYPPGTPEGEAWHQAFMLADADKLAVRPVSAALKYFRGPISGELTLAA